MTSIQEEGVHDLLNIILLHAQAMGRGARDDLLLEVDSPVEINVLCGDILPVGLCRRIVWERHEQTGDLMHSEDANGRKEETRALRRLC